VPEGDRENGWAVARANLDGGGRARLANLPVGPVQIEVEPGDGGWPVWKDLELAPVATPLVRIALRAGARVEGTVRDARTHAAISGARIGPPWFGPGSNSDAAGGFVVDSMPDDTSFLHVTRAGYARTSIRVERDAAGAPISPVAIELEAGFVLRGRIVDGRGAPVADAYVAATGQAWIARFLKSEWAATRTGADGAFELRDLNRALPRTVQARSEGLGAAQYDLPAPGPDATELDVGDIALVTGAHIVGRVVDPDGRPVSDLDVELATIGSDRGLLAPGSSPPSETHAARRRARTDDLGRFAFADVAPGESVVAVLSSATWISHAETAVTCAAGERVAPLELRVEPALSIRGIVLGADGAPLAGVSVQPEPPWHLCASSEG